MFESLKSKMKNLFSKADKHLDEEKVYKPEEPEQKPQAPEPVQEEPRKDLEPIPQEVPAPSPRCGTRRA